MSKPPELREVPDPPDEVQQAALDGNLVLFVGAGVSMLVDLPSWPDLAQMALEDLRQQGHLNYSEVEQLKGLDPKKQLSIAELKMMVLGAVWCPAVDILSVDDFAGSAKLFMRNGRTVN